MYKKLDQYYNCIIKSMFKLYWNNSNFIFRAAMYWKFNSEEDDDDHDDKNDNNNDDVNSPIILANNTSGPNLNEQS